MCVCKGKQRHVLLLTREINCMCKFRKCTRSWAQKGGSEGNAVIISQQLWDHQLDHQVNADKMPESQRPLQSLFQYTGIYLLSSYVSTIQILKPTLLRNSHPHNSMPFCRVPSKGPETRAAFSPPEISRQLRRAVSHQHSPWCGFPLIPAETTSCEGKFICCCQKRKRNWHKQLICSSPPTRWIMADELPPPQPSRPINKTARKAAGKGRWLLTYLPLC